MPHAPFAGVVPACALLLTLSACQGREPPVVPPGAELTWDRVQDSTMRVASITGLDGPEAVRYDPDQDVYFVSNFTGDPMVRDSSGFVSQVGADGTIEALRFATGTPERPLHAPRGMFITGDTLWTVDLDGVHGFDRRTGASLAYVDFTGFAPGFLNDIAAGPDGALHVTDTGLSRIYRLAGGMVTIASADSTLGQPNGITWDGANRRFLLAHWGGRQSLQAWRPADSALATYATSTGSSFDGVEVLDGRVLVASQADSSLHLVDGPTTRVIIRAGGRPADIGVDTRRRRVALPFVDLNRVDIWALPPEPGPAA